MKIPRPEHPRPQFQRESWLNLNGRWQFEIDQGDSGVERGLVEKPLKDSILVPFCPESKLSGIGNTDFLNAVWYRRDLKLPAAWKGQRVLLHFQAVDYDATVWVNGVEVGRHRGGFSSFSFDVTQALAGKLSAPIVVRARDRHDQPKPSGKQAARYHNFSCLYTRTTGIWQTVWVEALSSSYLARPRITPDLGQSLFRVTLPVQHGRSGQRIRAVLSDAQGRVSQAEAIVGHDFQPSLSLEIPRSRRKLWSPEQPHLYDLKFELLDASGAVLDSVASYAGLRSVTIEGKEIRLNGKPVFQRLVLDQGYYPDGIMTAPSEAALKRDITLGLEAGFNGARLHQKAFEERFLYHADQMGYLVWAEFGDWGANDEGIAGQNQRHSATFITQWLELLERDYSHPSIIGWCPLNETWQTLTEHITVLDDVTRGMFLATKAFDLSRPVLDSSGYSHREAATDVYDSHNYEQSPPKFKAQNKGLAQDQPFINGGSWDRSKRPDGKVGSVPYEGQPYFVSEFGGVWWNPKAKKGEDSWGYGDRPKTLAEFYYRFEGLCGALLDDPGMFGYCYTQLTDVYQEQNGIYTFDRKIKFDMKRISKAQTKIAAIEKPAKTQRGKS
jgi:beta-galactosidase/beta-glucuronidase